MNSFCRSVISIAMVSIVLAACGTNSPEASIASAKNFLAKNDLRSALIQIKNALQVRPEFAEARYLLGVALFEDGKPGPAVQELRKARSLKYSDEAVVPALAEALLATGDYAKLTEELAQSELTSGTSRARLQTALSKAYIALGEQRAADTALAAALTADPGFAPARLLQARKKAAIQDLDGALALLDGLLATAPTEVEALVLKGDILEHGKRDMAGAADYYRKAIKAKPNNISAHMAYLEALFVEKDLTGAAAAVAAMKKQAPDATQTIYEEARLAYLRKNDKLALERAQMLLKRNPENPAALQVAGAIELQANELTKAQAHLSYALQQAPQSLGVRQALAVTYLRLGNAEKALATLQPARAQGGDFPSWLFSLVGEIYLRNGDSERAETYFAKAAKLDAEDPGKRTTLALTRMIRGQVEPSFAELENIASTDKGNTADMALISARLQRGQFDKALLNIDALERKSPNDPFASQLRGRTELLMRKPADARKSFEKALQIKPNYFPAINSLAAMDLADKKPEEARKRYEAILKSEPSNSQALLALARIKAVTGADRGQVLDLVNKAVAADRFNVQARRALVDLYLANNDLKGASAAAEDAVAVIPDNPELLEALGTVQKNSGESGQGLATFRKLAALQPELPGPLVRIADIQMGLADSAGAEQTLRKALELAPSLLDAQLRLVSLQVHDRRYPDALAVAMNVQKQRPKEAAGYLLEGDVALARGDRAAALAVYRRGLTQTSSTPLALKIHSLLLASSSSNEAASFANGWVKEHPSDSSFLFHLGDVALTHKDYGGAIERYLAVIRIQPKNAAAYNNLAWLSDQTGKASALEYARKAVEIEPTQSAYLDTLATVLASAHDFPEAIKVQKTVLAAHPDDPQWRLTLAKIYKQAGDKKAARQELEVLAKLGTKFSAQPEVAALLGTL